MVNAILSIAKKEFMDNYRNQWIIALSAIFVILPIIVSYFGSQPLGAGFRDFKSTINGMRMAVQSLIPIIGLMLGYATIVGEIEKGSIGVLLSLPATRTEVIIGKFLGLGSVICSTILIGFGTAGIIIAANISDPDYGLYLIFIGTSILLGLVFVGLALFFSSFFKKRSAAIGGAIFLWIFFTMFWQFLMFALLLVTRPEGVYTMPDWFYTFQLFNPIMVHSLIDTPNAPSAYLILLSLMAWILIPLIASFWIFRRRDV